MTTSLDIVIPVLNEEAGLAVGVGRLGEFLSERLGDYRWRIVVADNGSSDSTPEIGRRLAREDERMGYIRLEQRGRGRALSRAWRESEADIVGYMDVDLSTDLDALPALVEAIRSEGYDVAVGSRLRPGARVIGRSFRRELASRAYSAIFRSMFLTGFHDAQCGFKAVSRRVVNDVVPLVKDTGWFFDTELLILAEKNGYRVREVPVTWTDDPDSRVKLVSTAYGDMKGLLRLRLGGLRKASMALRSDYEATHGERPSTGSRP
ncbi:MAG: glycosyltransferase family 2 protein [Chloroflexi bacterium]|nr:glycosyltransferase family 2 protein [Chloroflexota bacterium]